jgi:hypothetical protein
VATGAAEQAILPWAGPATAAGGVPIRSTVGLSPPLWLALTLACAGMAVVVTAAPLAVYGLAIALFGLPHVLAELRFLDLRYADGVGRRVLRPLLLLLAGACAMRLAGSYGWLPRDVAIPGELLLVSATALPLMARLGTRRWTALLVTGGFAAAAATAPFHTLLVLAVAHNLTPVAFVGHALLERRERVLPAAAAALLIFGAIPLAIALGLGSALLTAIGVTIDPDAMVISSGPLGRHLGTVVPPEITDPRLTLNLFAAAVYLQCIHYGAVIHLMPRLLPDGPRQPTLVGWPRRPWMGVALAVAGMATGAAFFVDFGEARRLYSTVAAFHAWIEVPILLLMLAGRVRPSPSSR